MTDKKDNDPIPESTQNAVTESQQLTAAMVADYGAERDLVNQLLGQAQMASASEDFFRTVRISKLSEVKETKAYRGLKGMKTPHGAEFSGTWADFCKALGRSVDQVDRDIAALREFGEQALESMQQMGIGYRQLRDFRRLPEDEKTALAETAETGDKDQFLELAETLIAKHQKEKDALTQERDDAVKDATAKDAVLADKATRIAELETMEKRIKTLPPDAQGEAIRKEAASLCFDVECALRDTLFTAIESVQKHAAENGLEPPIKWAEGQILHLDEVFLMVACELGVGIERTGTAPEWEDAE